MPVTLVKSEWKAGELRFSSASGATTFVTDKYVPVGSISHQSIGANDTLNTDGDSGQVFYVTADAKVITLPATVVGVTYTIVNAGTADAAVGVTISPAAADKIMGAGITSADNKDLINTKATAKVGDYVKLVGDGVNGWYIQEMVGTWAREA